MEFKMENDFSRIKKTEYTQKFIESDYYKNDIFESKVYENFLTDAELDVFDEAARSDDVFYVHDTSMGPVSNRLFGEDPESHTTANYYIFENFYSKPEWSKLVDIIQPKLESTFGEGIYASHIHVLESCFPYGLHNDAEQPNMNIAPKPAWTLIIPFDDYPSKTYVFNERCGYKDPWSWIHNENIQPNETYCVSDETYEKDFVPITDKELMK